MDQKIKSLLKVTNALTMTCTCDSGYLSSPIMLLHITRTGTPTSYTSGHDDLKQQTQQSAIFLCRSWTTPAVLTYFSDKSNRIINTFLTEQSRQININCIYLWSLYQVMFTAVYCKVENICINILNIATLNF